MCDITGRHHESQKMNVSWICLSVKTKNAELEISNRKKPSHLPRGSLRHNFLGLLEHLTGGRNQSFLLLEGLFKGNRVSSVRDVHVSSFYGQKTSRIQYLFPEYNILPVKGNITLGKTSLCSEGLSSEINKIKVRSNVCIDVIVTSVDAGDIDKVLEENPEWFCGEMDDLNKYLTNKGPAKP